MDKNIFGEVRLLPKTSQAKEKGMIYFKSKKRVDLIYTEVTIFMGVTTSSYHNHRGLSLLDW